MKKIFSIAAIVACTMMVFSCKNGNKNNEAEGEAAAECTECTEGACEKAESEKCADCTAAESESAEEAAAAQEALKDLGDIIPAAAAEVKAAFNGGNEASFLEYVQSNIKYPSSALENGDEGRVLVSFVVDENGKIVNPKVVKGVNAALDAEALRVISEAPAWTPAKAAGKNIPVTYTMPVSFKIVK